MESLTRLVSESLARHGFDRPVDYRRLRWSQWFRCESHHSLLSVPSKPGVFAFAEEIMDMGSRPVGTSENSPAFQRRESRENAEPRPVGTPETDSYGIVDGHNRAECVRRLLAVTQFFDADDMAFVLDRMLSAHNPMRARLISGRYFVRYVVIEDETQRRSISIALNQWIVSAGEKASGIGAHFASSLELSDFNVGRTLVGRTLLSANPNAKEDPATSAKPASLSAPAPHLDSGASTNIHCPSPFPSGF
jgi:hypothetical protein